MSSFATDKAAQIITGDKSHNKTNVRLVYFGLFYITSFHWLEFYMCVSDGKTAGF
jgi:hypothetical protein